MLRHYYKFVLFYLLWVSACAGRKWEEVRDVSSYITEVELKGVHRFKKKELLEYLNIGETSVLFWKPKYPFNEGVFPTDRQRILELYHAYGYYDVSVLYMTYNTKAGKRYLCGKHKGERKPGKTTISIGVREGRPTRVNSVELHWPKGLPEGPRDSTLTTASLQHVLKIREGDVFEIAKLNTSAAALEYKLRSRGYAFAEVEEKAVVDQGRRVDVNFEITPGPYVKIGDIHIKGLVQVPEKYVRNEVMFAEGKRFSPALLKQIESSVFAMDVFRSVLVDVQKQSETPGFVDLTVRVVEGNMQSVKVGPGLRIEPIRWEQRARLVYTHRNLGRNLTRFDLDVTAGYAELPALYEPREHGPLVRLEPRFRQKGLLEKGIIWTLAPNFELGIWEGYQFYSPTLRMGTARFFTRFVHLELTYNLRFVDFFNVSPSINENESILGRDFRDPYLLSYIEPVLSFYFIDSILKPRNGVVLATLYDLAGLGGMFSFHKVKPTLRAYYTPHRRVTLAAQASVGFIFPFGRRAGVPIDMKFYLGGSDTVRGWGMRRLSPKVYEEGCVPGEAGCEGVPVGGRTMVLGNAEVRVRPWDKIELVAFFDAGDVREGIRSFQPRNWNYSIGPGIRYDSPVGIFRLDVGFRLNETDQSFGERGWAIHLGLGEAF